MGPRAGLDGRKISSPHRHSISDHPARSSFAIPTELPGQRISLKCCTQFISRARQINKKEDFSPIVHATFPISNFAIKFEVLKEFYAFPLLLADGKSMVAGWQCVHRVGVLLCKKKRKAKMTLFYVSYFPEQEFAYKENGIFYWTVVTQQCGAIFILCN